MATEVGAKVQVEFSSVGQMRKAIKEATSDLIAMQEQFGKTSPQAIAAAKRIAELKDKIQDAKEQADLFDPGKRFSAFANAANQIAAGFSAVQGAMALVGTESEDLQKTLVKVQGAIALSQGLSQLKDLGKAYDEIKIVAVNAFRAIKTAIGSTGIGLLVVALGAIVAYWDDIKAAVSGVSSEQKKLNAEADKNLKTQQDKLSAINSQENILKLQGKSEKEILQIKVKQTDETIKAAEVQLQNNIATTKAQVEASKRNKEILQGILEFVTAPLGLLLKGVDAVGKALGKNFDIYDKFYGSISSFVFDPKQVEEEGNKTIKEQEKALTELKNQRAGFQLQINDIDKKANEKRAADNKKQNEEAAKARAEAENILYESRKSLMNQRDAELLDLEKKRVEEEKKLIAASIKDRSAFDESYRKQKQAIDDKYNAEDQKKLEDFNKQLNKINNDARLSAIKDVRLKEIEELKLNYEGQRKTIEENEKLTSEQRFILLAALRQKENQDLAAIDEKFKQSELTKQSDQLLKDAESDQLTFEARLAKVQEREALLNQITFASQEEKTAFEKANAAARIAIAEDEANAKIKFTQDIGNALGVLSDVIGRETAAGKALAVAQATINTWLGVTEVLKQKSVLPEPAATISKVVNVAAIVASGLKAVSNIVKTQVPRGGGGGGSAPSVAGGGGAPVAAAATPAVISQAVTAQAVNNLGNQAMRAYVLNSDITNNDQRNAYLQRNARLG